MPLLSAACLHIETYLAQQASLQGARSISNATEPGEDSSSLSVVYTNAPKYWLLQ